MSPTGAASDSAAGDSARQEPTTADSSFLPNFCEPRMVLAVVLVSELLAFVFSLVRSAGTDFLTELARISMLMQWLGLTSAALLCLLRLRLGRASTGITTVVVLGIVLVNILILSIAMNWAGRWLGAGETLGMFPAETRLFVIRNLVIGAIVTALLLRYFFVSHQWRLHVQAEARSRIDALQARIRPHFLFNSMNTIASLTRSDPDQAEKAVEDLADLFRATLNDAGRLLTLKEEFELTRIYQRIEMLRLGDRLRVDWDIAELPMRARLPGLTIQPLLENAIYHGIERLDGGGVVKIVGHCVNDEVEINVTNPVGEAEGGQLRQGHQIAVNNIRERLLLAFDGSGALEVAQTGGTYRATVRFPVS